MLPPTNKAINTSKISNKIILVIFSDCNDFDSISTIPKDSN